MACLGKNQLTIGKIKTGFVVVANLSPHSAGDNAD